MRFGDSKLFVVLLSIGLGAGLGSGLGCTESPYGTGAQRYFIPWPDASGHYRQQAVPIATFSHPESLNGSYATILVNPFLSAGGSSGGSPVGRFVQGMDDVLYPADTTTRQATTVYAHFEALHAMDAEAGVGEGSHWPATIGIRASFFDSSSQGAVALTNNALYDGTLDTVFVVPFSPPSELMNGPDQPVPLVYNAGVAAHEHFHAVFNQTVLSKMSAGGGRVPGLTEADEWAETTAVPPRNRRSAARAERLAVQSVDQFNDFILRGINEGLADFWAWVYTGDDLFLLRSLPWWKVDRRLDRASEPFTAREEWERTIAAIKADVTLSETRQDILIMQTAYSLGTENARFFRTAAIELAGGDRSRSARLAAAGAVGRALPLFASAVKPAYDGKQRLDPRAGARAFALALSAPSQPGVALAEGAPPALPDSLCCLFVRNVGNEAVDRPNGCLCREMP